MNHLVEHVYQASTDAARWPEALAHIAAHFGASRGMLYAFSPKDARLNFVRTHNIPDTYLQTYAALGSDKDPFVTIGVRKGLFRQGLAVLGQDIIASADIESTPFFQQLWKPLDIYHLCTGAVFDGSDPQTTPTVMALYRPSTMDAFNEADRAAYAQVLRHVSRAMGIMFCLRDHERKLAATEEALDALSHGVVMLDASGAISWENQAARTLLDHGEPLRRMRSAQGRFRLAVAERLAERGPELAELLQSCCEPSEPHSPPHFTEAVVLPGRTGSGHLVVHAAPARTRLQFQPDGTATLVFLSDLATPTIDPKRLQSALGLSAAEARVAAQVFRGGTTADIAAALGVGLNTVKSQLKAVYRKTGVESQSGLLRLLAGLAVVRQG